MIFLTLIIIVPAFFLVANLFGYFVVIMISASFSKLQSKLSYPSDSDGGHSLTTFGSILATIIGVSIFALTALSFFLENKLL